MSRSCDGAFHPVPDLPHFTRCLLILGTLALALGCADSPAGQLDVKVMVSDDLVVQDLAFFLRVGSEADYATGVSIRSLESVGGLDAQRAVAVTLKTSQGISQRVLIGVVGCSGPISCKCVDEDCDALTRSLGPDCTCEGTQSFGADALSIGELRELAITLRALGDGCDADGDLIPDCTRMSGNEACCAGLSLATQTRITDCLDSPTSGRRASPFRASEVAASAASTPRLLARHRALCGDGIDNDCRAPGDEPCGDVDGDGVPSGQDCDDDNPAINPGAQEVCGNEIDENCDGFMRCDQDNDRAFDDVDCDDNNPSRFPGNAEICGDGIDQNCIEGDDQCLDDADIDGDGYTCSVDHRWQVGHCRDSDENCALRGSGCLGPDQDCDDSNAAIYPGAPERCGDGIDQDCDGADLQCPPNDNDGDGVPAASAGGTDCDDGDFDIAPGRPERCGDGVDQDCDGQDLPCAADSDRDNDGWPAPGDCLDGDPNVYPGAEELCNGADDDCDGRLDEGNPLKISRDGPAAPRSCGQECSGAACGCRLGFNICTGQGQNARIECFGVGPDERPEVCDGVDNDCDGRLDETLTAPCYDGEDNELMAPQTNCRGGTAQCAVDRQVRVLNCVEDSDCPTGRCTAGTCSKASEYGRCDGQVMPSNEQCSGVNEDCDANVDEGVTRACGSDVGLCMQGLQMCLGGGRWAEACDGEVGPRNDVCDGQDNNCSGDVDEAFRNGPQRLGRGCTRGQGACRRDGRYVCSEDGQRTVCNARPGQPAREICDGEDNDCNGQTPDGSDDERVGRPCDGRDSDRCEEGTFRCERGRIICSDNTGDTPELCDGDDNDCDGETDENFAQLGQGCRAGEGLCAEDGRFVCSEDRRELVCDAVPAQGMEETCDGSDNDCDGDIDEGAANDACDQGMTDRCANGRCVCGQTGGPCDPMRAERCADGRCRCGNDICEGNERCDEGECTAGD